MNNIINYIFQELPHLILITALLCLIIPIFIFVIIFVKSIFVKSIFVKSKKAKIFWIKFKIFWIKFKKEKFFWIKLWLSILASCITFLSIDYFQQQNSLRNEPLLLKNKIDISVNSSYNSKEKINISIPLNRQGMISEAYLLYFKNNDSTVRQIIPLNFNNNNNNQLNASIILNSNPIYGFDFNLLKNSSIEALHYDNKLLITNTMQLGLILKDSKGNIIVRYFIVRPSMKTHNLDFYYPLKNRNNGQIIASLYRKCNNKLPSSCINLPVMIENKDNIRQNLQNNSNMFDVNFHLIKNSKVSWKENFDSFCINIINYGFCKSFQMLLHHRIKSTNPRIIMNYYTPNSDEVSKNIGITKNYAFKIKNNIN